MSAHVVSTSSTVLHLPPAPMARRAGAYSSRSSKCASGTNRRPPVTKRIASRVLQPQPRRLLPGHAVPASGVEARVQANAAGAKAGEAGRHAGPWHGAACDRPSWTGLDC